MGFLVSIVVSSHIFNWFSVDGLPGNSRVRGVNLGGWLVIEGWIKPSLFNEIPNNDMIDGTEVQLKSVTNNKYVSADDGGRGTIAVDRDIPLALETFRLWRVSESIFQFRSSGGQFLTCNGDGGNVSAAQRTPGWDDNAATFKLTTLSNNLHGDYQLANGYGHQKAEEVYKKHRDSFITVDDFNFLYRHGINTVRIPVGWWIAHDPNPPPPYFGGSLQALDNAFSWAQEFNIKCIIDLHAAPGSQNGMEHSSSRDGTTGWPTSSYISQTLHVIDFLASRYAKHPSLLGIELLNEPSASTVPLDTLVSYYKQGHQTVRKYSSTAYVIFCQRIGNADPLELYQANLGDSNTVIDLHYYNLFDNFFVNMTSLDNIDYIYKSRQTQVQALNGANGPRVFIGEWVNEWNVANGSQTDYQDFGRAQLEVYNAASFGWSYWTLKNDRNHWDFEWNVRNNYLQLQLGCSSFWRASIRVVLLGLASGFYFL